MKRFAQLVAVIALAAVNTSRASAQTPWTPTRFTITGAPILSKPRGEFARNIGDAFGGFGGVLYHVDRTGIASLRFDISGVPYGEEKKRVPISPTIGERVLVDLTTSNWIAAFSLGPELAVPRGAVRPYINSGFSELLFRTTSSVAGTGSSESFAGTTNYKDSTSGWFLGGGARIPVGVRNLPDALRIDLGVRYTRAGTVSYLRPGSIQDSPDGSISFSPLTSSAPQLVYSIGVSFRIPHNANVHCPRLLC